MRRAGLGRLIWGAGHWENDRQNIIGKMLSAKTLTE
jgi:hypothetical protein